jgi:HSP20 family protein
MYRTASVSDTKYLSLAASPNDVERIFEHFFSQKNLFTTIPHTPWSPPTDVYETPNGYVVKLEIPGLDATDDGRSVKDVDVILNHNVLTICGYRRDHGTETKLGFHQMEIHYGYFERVVTLPHSIDGESLKGQYKDGFMSITIGKTVRRTTSKRRIHIHSREPGV